MEQFQKTTEIVTHNILLFAVLILIVGTISFLLAKKFGGKSKAKKNLIFTLSGGIGLLLVATYIAKKINGL